MGRIVRSDGERSPAAFFLKYYLYEYYGRTKGERQENENDGIVFVRKRQKCPFRGTTVRVDGPTRIRTYFTKAHGARLATLARQGALGPGAVRPGVARRPVLAGVDEHSGIVDGARGSPFVEMTAVGILVAILLFLLLLGFRGLALFLPGFSLGLLLLFGGRFLRDDS